TVEREVAGLEVLEREAADGAGQRLGEGQRWPLGDLDVGDAIGERQGGLEGLGEALLDALPPDETVDDDLDRVLVVAIELDLLGQFPDLTVDAGAGEALLDRKSTRLNSSHVKIS